MDKKNDKNWYREAALDIYGSNELDFAENAKVEIVEDGAWVTARVWVSAPDEEDE